MDYRDERDALRARIESLEGALASAQAEAERVRATEAALDAARREVMLLRSELERYRSPTGQQKQGRMWPLLVALAALMAGAFGFAMIARRPSPAPDSTPPWTPPPESPQSEPAAPVRPIEPVKPVEPVQEPAPPPEPPLPTTTVNVEWKAVVTRAQGAAMPGPGAACVVSAELRGDGKSASVRDLEVRCGDKILHRSTDKFNGMSSTGSDVTEADGKAPGTFQYGLSYVDQGARTGRSQISLDTDAKTLVVWSDAPVFRVELRVEPLTAPRTGPPLIEPKNRVEKIRETVVRTGTIQQLEGTPGLAKGAVCTVDVSPASGKGYNCRVRVRCGGRLIYGDGNSGFNECTIQNGRGEKVNDDRPSSVDHDPTLSLDLSEDTALVTDDGESPFKIQIALTRPAK